MQPLHGRTALVTGGNRGLGAGIALALAAAGAAVAVNYRTHADEAQQVCDTITAGGGRAAAFQADVRSGEAVTRLVAEAQAALGPIDILVNNAGIAIVEKLEEMTEASWNEIIAVNLTSCFLVTQAVLPHMRQQRWGRIINMSSVAAQIGSAIGPHYAASKAGMIGLTHGYAALLVTEGITVNAIAPALVETEMVTGVLRASPTSIPMGRFGTPDEVASVAVMLATNAYITGQTISVNGGRYMG